MTEGLNKLLNSESNKNNSTHFLDNKSSYLMENCELHISNNLPVLKMEIETQTFKISPSIMVIKNYIDQNLLEELENSTNVANSKTKHCLPNTIQIMDEYKIISHEQGRRDVWNIVKPGIINLPDNLSHLKLVPKSIGCLYLDPQTTTFGKWHKDAVDLFYPTPNTFFPPFYYNMIICTTDQTEKNGPTQFLINDRIVWFPLTRGDIVLFDGTVSHRGTPNLTDEPRNLIYATFAKVWYNEENL